MAPDSEEMIRAEVLRLAGRLEACVDSPPSPEQRLAMQSLRTAAQWLTGSLARQRGQTALPPAEPGLEDRL